jgi:catechol 2,3-dioxygenase-like lactoylglutathione lyase family enzyme
MRFERAIPILRVFDRDKAHEFYIGYLGFTEDWEHRFEPDSPRYSQVSRSDLVIHLSEHYGDGTPGTAVFLPVHGIGEFHAEITGRDYMFARPGLESEPWGLTVDITDPFGNHLRFCEPVQ